jgi:hypothetical protein
MMPPASTTTAPPPPPSGGESLSSSSGARAGRAGPRVRLRSSPRHYDAGIMRLSRLLLPAGTGFPRKHARLFSAKRDGRHQGENYLYHPVGVVLTVRARGSPNTDLLELYSSSSYALVCMHVPKL